MAKIIDTNALKEFLKKLSSTQLSDSLFIATVTGPGEIAVESDGMSFTTSGAISISGSNQYIGVGSKFSVILSAGATLYLNGLIVLDKSTSSSSLFVKVEQGGGEISNATPYTTITAKEDFAEFNIYVGVNGICAIAQDY